MSAKVVSICVQVGKVNTGYDQKASLRCFAAPPPISYGVHRIKLLPGEGLDCVGFLSQWGLCLVAPGPGSRLSL